MNLEKLGTLIQKKREDVGIPLAKAAKKAGIGRSTLWILERGESPQTGKPARPAKDILERLAEALYMSQEETDELLLLADYRVAKQPSYTSPYRSAAREPVPTPPVITKLDDVIYYAHDGKLAAFDAETGRPRWPKPAQLPSIPGGVRDTEPLSSEKRATRLSTDDIPPRQPTLEASSGVADTPRKKKRRS